MNTKKKKNILIIALVAVILLMATAFAVLSQQLNITGNTTLQSSTWQVEITGITVASKSGSAVSSGETFTLTSASFNTELSLLGDSVTYNVTVENKGTIDATLQSVTSNIADLVAAQEYIKYTLTGATVDSTLAAGATTTVGVVVTYDANATSVPAAPINQSLNITLNYVQQ